MKPSASAPAARASARDDFFSDFLRVSSEALRRRGDLDQALQQIDDAVRSSDPGSGEAPLWMTMNYTLNLIHRGDILGGINALSLGRPEAALEPLDLAFRIADQH